MKRTIYVESAGVRCGLRDGLAIEVMEEIGIDISKHKPIEITELLDNNFDMIISLTPKAHHIALEYTRMWDIEVEYWPTINPTIAEGNREQRLEAYRQVRDELYDRIKVNFCKKT